MSGAPNSPEVIYISSDTDEEVTPKKKKYRGKVKRSSWSRGHGAHRKRVAKHHRYFKRVRDKRESMLHLRQALLPEEDWFVSPTLRTCAGNDDQEIVREHRQWYFQHPGTGPVYLELRSKCVANPNADVKDNGHQGVFVLQDIPKGFVICPYVGMVMYMPKNVTAYSLALTKDSVVDAQKENLDVGYLYKCMNARVKCPPNYGKFINSLDPRIPWQKKLSEDPARGLNCDFTPYVDGSDTIWIVASRNIRNGEELLLDYGKEYDWKYWGLRVRNGKVQW